jgi:hypothetical protein
MFTPVAASRLEVSDSSSISLDHYSCSNAKIFSDSGSKVRQLALFLKVLISRAESVKYFVSEEIDGHPALKLYGKSVQCGFPIPDGHRPLLG